MVAIQQVGIVPPWLGGGDIPRIMDDATLPVLPLPPLPPDWDAMDHYDYGDPGTCTTRRT